MYIVSKDFVLPQPLAFDVLSQKGLEPGEKEYGNQMDKG
jgi:hypothetical protein